MKLYRYITFETLADIVINKRLALVSPLIWEDAFEGWFWKAIVIDGKPEHSEPISKAINSLFAQCWSKNCDSAALWSIYSYNQKSIMIETTSEKLQKLPKITIKEINYSDDAEMDVDEVVGMLMHPSLDNLLLPFTKKRSEFSHENEVRIFTTKKNPDGFLKAVHIPIYDVDTFINNVVVHPFAPEWYIDIIREFCKNYHIQFSGKSKLYDFDHGKLR